MKKNRTFLASCTVFKAMTAKVTVLWDATPCLLVEIYRFFGGTNCLSLEAGGVASWRLRAPRDALHRVN